MAHTLDLERLDEVFEAIEANDKKLTTWETEFFESVQEQWKRKGKLSEKQLEVLERIYLKI